MRIKVHPQNPQPAAVERAAEILRDGGVIVYPTDTIYGLGCDLHDKRAVERIYRIKRLEPGKPLSIVCADLSHISEYANISKADYRILKHQLPGPYTFVLEASRQVPRLLTTKQKTIGIRIPNHPFPLALVKALGRPLITTSVTDPRFDVPAEQKELLNDPEDIESRYGKLVDCVFDAGVLSLEPSTVISLEDGVPILIRKGIGKVFWEEPEEEPGVTPAG
ncbi:MAG: L-threonylcarbamoyladenylate synthase [Bdellovibrionota bacterium]